MKTLSALVALLAIAVVSASEATIDADGSATVADDVDQDKLANDIISWIREHKDGYVNEKIELRPGAGGARGVFVNDSMKKNEVICTIPWDLIVKPTKAKSFKEGFQCATFRKIYNGMKDLKTPYEKYLNTMPRNSLPGWWSDNGRAFLKDMVGDRFPASETFRLVKEGKIKEWIAVERCGKSEEDSSQDMFHDSALWNHAVSQVHARADDWAMVRDTSFA